MKAQQLSRSAHRRTGEAGSATDAEINACRGVAVLMSVSAAPVGLRQGSPGARGGERTLLEEM